MTSSSESGPPPSRVPWPPLLFIAVIIGGRVLDVSLDLPKISFGSVKIVGGILCALGLVNNIWCALTLRGHNTTILPHRAVATLVTSGPYRFSRNPIYISELALTVGIALVLRSWTILALTPPLFFALTKLAVEPEERHLREKFGAKFDAFCARTPRWL